MRKEHDGISDGEGCFCLIFVKANLGLIFSELALD